MAPRFKGALSAFLIFSLAAAAGVAAAEVSADQTVGWDELESQLAAPRQDPGPAAEEELLKRRELEKQLSAQFASLSRGLSNMPAPPDVRNKEISFGSSASSKRK